MRRAVGLGSLILLLTSLASGPSWGQSKWKVPEKIKDKAWFVKAPVFPDIHETPGLPRVLIIGDSISMQYGPEVRRLLEGKANVYRIPDNGRTTKFGLSQLDYWMGDGHWAVIHFNFGLHDLNKNDSHLPIADYEKNLKQIVKQLQSTGAKLIWASTTPVPVGIEKRIESDVIAYNTVAKKIMGEHHVPINDLHARVLSWDEQGAGWQLDEHFRAEGYTDLAAEVARCILAALQK